MGKITEDQIFAAARSVLIESGVNSLRMTAIAKRLDVSHAALYKHFSNRKALVAALIKNWLSQIDQPILAQAVRLPETERIDGLHDWLQNLVQQRQTAFQTDPALTKLYVQSVNQQSELLNDELLAFANRVEYMMAWDTFRQQRGITVMMAFTYFYHPYFMNKWDGNLTLPLFESTWIELLPILTQ
ncbi:helix-turn-helix transcriptional regulator [Weissella coleopterorum]|uniref:Helix-turn-helix transcriptional regulator n=1 Tax=Weissella coleopterorum TaxID=2714949 RepID=A0A6G8AYI9_9LACO|nr:TetR/AcrR family transcriptional regulator [Weissella coleopterorum]QIL50022.1 helix-turn-helix transcriptional regulator [Weissella coleopterorum]